MKNTLVTLIFGLLALAATAQEHAVYSHYQVMPQLINPATAGQNNEHLFMVNGRNAWAAFPETPTTYTFMYTGPVGDKLGLGASVLSERLGAQSINRIQGIYSFRFKLQNAEVGLGLTTEFLRRTVNSDVLSNPIIDPGDKVLEGAVGGQQVFSSSFGASVVFDKSVFASIVLPSAIRARLDEIPVDNPETENGAGTQYYILQLGAIIDVPSQSFKLVPSLAIRQIRDVPFQVDLNLQARFMDEKVIAGLTYRPMNKGSMAFLAGTKVGNLNLYYSYDISFGPFQQYNIGSHEITAAYALPRKKPAVPIQNTNLHQQGE
ncbi:MAG: PorP/SprF family type IX secretion system membrane protein [Saprospiraceae bacterium]